MIPAAPPLPPLPTVATCWLWFSFWILKCSVASSQTHKTSNKNPGGCSSCPFEASRMRGIRGQKDERDQHSSRVLASGQRALRPGPLPLGCPAPGLRHRSYLRKARRPAENSVTYSGIGHCFRSWCLLSMWKLMLLIMAFCNSCPIDLTLIKGSPLRVSFTLSLIFRLPPFFVMHFFP